MRSAIRSTLILIILISTATGFLNSQESDKGDPMVIELDKIISDDKRDEIQRYFGYEDLLFRYLTLPYDLSSNTNQQGRNVDFGYAIFMLLPIVFLGLVYKHKRLFYTSLIVLFLFLSLCLSYSFHFTPFHGQVNNHGAKWQSYTANNDKSIIESLTTGFFNLSHYASRPIHALGNKISGNTDHSTYPILIALFLGMMWLVLSRLKLSSRGQFVASIFIPFSFLWLLLSSGIIWYGFLIIPLALAGIVHYCYNCKFKNYASQNIIKNIILTMLVLWICMCWVGRVSNINTLQAGSDANHIGKGIVDNNTFQYSTGIINAQQSRAKSYANINDALEKVNSNDALIYQVGTFFAFDIKNNSERLFQDNTLPQFFWLVKVLKEKGQIIDAMKASNFKYILIDLYTHTLDKTPERSLTDKYKLLLNVVYQNPKVKLMATDRIIEVKQEDGSKARVSEVFGENIFYFGSYAIYEIL